MSNDKNVPTDIDAHYEAVARQEEIYLEVTEEVVRAILVSENSTLDNATTECWQRKLEDLELVWRIGSMSDENNDPRIGESLEESLDHAAEELITGDSDDPPISEEVVAEILRATHLPKRSSQCL